MKKIVVIGGGTGNFTLLSGLKTYPIDITAVVAMSDDGGSTGVLRDEFGVLPPGDVRQCLVALSESTDLMRKLFNYRFDRGIFFGHPFGNLFITAMERVTGNFEKAVEEISDVLKIKGRVLPVTTNDVHLCVKLDGRKIIKGENKITGYPLARHKKREFYLEPEGVLNPKVKKAIEKADLVVGERNFSLMPWKSRIGNVFTAKIFGMFFGNEVSDTQSGFRVISREFIEDILKEVKLAVSLTRFSLLISLS